MESIDRDALGSLPILIGQDGFPGELSSADASRARQLIEATGAEAVIVAVGAEMFWRVEESDQRAVRLVGVQTATADGFALGVGDGATLPGVPLDWDLLVFACPHRDTVVLLAQYPHDPLSCSTHQLPLDLVDPGS